MGSISNLTTIHVDAGNPNYSSEDGVLFNKDKTTLIFCPIGKTGSSGSYVIPNTVTTIGEQAFASCYNLTELTFGSSVTTISTYIFQSCYNLTTINVDAGNPNYSSEDGVLFNKDKTTLIFCPTGKAGSYVIPNTVTTIGEQAFANCYNLTELTLGSSVTTIVGWCHYSGNLNPDGTVTEELICIEGAAFTSCYNLTAINVDAGNPNFSVEEGVLFNKDKTTLIFCLRGKTGSYVIPNTVTTIGEGAFANCDNLTTVTNLNPTPQKVEYIYEYDNGYAHYVYQGVPAFGGVDISACTLRVPVGSAAAYKAAAIWKDFGTIVEIE
jgi:hypothetical protein